MYKIGDRLKVPVLMVQEGKELNKGYAYGVVLGESTTVEDATELKVELGEGRFAITNIKNTQLAELND